MDLHGKVFTVKIPFVCEVRRPLLSLATLEDKGFHLTVKKMAAGNLEVMVESLILRRQGNSHLVDVEFRGGLLECKRTTLRGSPGLVAPVDSGVAGLPAAAGVEPKRANLAHRGIWAFGRDGRQGSINICPNKDWCDQGQDGESTS